MQKQRSSQRKQRVYLQFQASKKKLIIIIYHEYEKLHNIQHCICKYFLLNVGQSKCFSQTSPLLLKICYRSRQYDHLRNFQLKKLFKVQKFILRAVKVWLQCWARYKKIIHFLRSKLEILFFFCFFGLCVFFPIPKKKINLCLCHLDLEFGRN